MKKFIVVSMVLCFFAGNKASAQTWNIGYPDSTAVTATLNTTDSVLTISGTGAMVDWWIGSSFYPDWWYSSRSFIKSVVIDSGVTNIGDYAFYQCRDLTSVIIPNSVTTIGDLAFSGCWILTSVIIPDSVTTIGEMAFSGCSLTSMIIPNSVTTIGGDAFMNCVDLTSVTISNSVTTIGASTFYSCRSLTSVIIPNSVTTIEMQAFEGCSGLTSLTIGNSVTMIGNWAFRNCIGLTSIYIKALTPPSCNDSTFYNVKDTIPVHVPCGTATLYQGWGGFTNIIEDITLEEVTVNSNNLAMGTATITKFNTCTDNEAQITASSLSGYHFVRWHDGDTSNPRTITVTQDTSFTAEFAADGNSIVGALRATPLQVYPNPARDNITISLPDQTTHAVFTLYDLQGRTLLNRTINNGETVSVDGLSAGMYVYSLLMEGKRRQGKLSIVK